jgi:hypothetical protein
MASSVVTRRIWWPLQLPACETILPVMIRLRYTLSNYGKRVADGEIDDPTFFMAAWQAPESADHKDPETWRIANPGFGDINS